jgi:hypothetical protein
MSLTERRKVWVVMGTKFECAPWSVTIAVAVAATEPRSTDRGCSKVTGGGVFHTLWRNQLIRLCSCDIMPF